VEVVGLDRLSLVAFPDPLRGPEQVALGLESPLQFAGTRILVHPGFFRHPYCSIPFSITASGLAVGPAILAAKAAASRNTYTGAGRYADCIAGIPRGRRPASGEADAPSPGEALRRGGNPLCSGPLPALDIPRSLSKPKGKPRKHQDGPSSCPLGPSEGWGFPTVLSGWGWGLSPRSVRNMLRRANR